MALLTFERKEIKYLITKQQKDEIIKRLNDKITLDEYASNKGTYQVFSLYFDNDNNDIIRYNLSKPKLKEKFRVRCYQNDVTNDMKVFLEIKRKFKGFGNKRRISMRYSEYQDFISQDFSKHENEKFEDYYYRIKKINYLNEDGNFNYLRNQIEKEIIYYFYINNANPKCYIESIRNAYFDNNDGNIRITFDSNIIVRREDVCFENKNGDKLLDDNHMIMEIKVLHAIPLYIVNVLSDLKIYPQGFSKYGKVYERELKIKNLNLEDYLY